MRQSAAVVVVSCWMVMLSGCASRSHPRAEGAVPAGDTASPGAHPRRNTTGATDSLPMASLEREHVEDIAELLRGRVPGLEVIRLPNGDVSLRIRGTDSITEEGEPLLVIDGMPVAAPNLSGALRSLRPHEIASIEVLKDVSSTSVYGMRGAHGVIVITTKHD
jgi:TonB-dependent SusC/RagA subfamily outer membrane receptor